MIVYTKPYYSRKKIPQLSSGLPSFSMLNDAWNWKAMVLCSRWPVIPTVHPEFPSLLMNPIYRPPLNAIHTNRIPPFLNPGTAAVGITRTGL